MSTMRQNALQIVGIRLRELNVLRHRALDERGLGEPHDRRLALPAPDLDTLSAAELLDETPFLVVHGTVDDLLHARGRAGDLRPRDGPKEIEWIETPNHIDIYDDPSLVVPAVKRVARFLGEQLAPRERRRRLRGTRAAGGSVVGRLDADEVARAGDLGEAGSGNLGGEVARDRVEVGLVALADHDERRDAQLRERTQVGPLHLRLGVRRLQLERAALLRPHLVAERRRDPEVHVHVGRAIEVARLDRSLLLPPVRVISSPKLQPGKPAPTSASFSTRS